MGGEWGEDVDQFRIRLPAKMRTDARIARLLSNMQVVPEDVKLF